MSTEGQNGDRGLVRQREVNLCASRGGLGHGAFLGADPIGTHRFGDVLYGLFSKVIESCAHLALHRVADRIRHRDSARLCQTFEACGDIDAISIYGAVSLLNDLAEMNANPEAHAPVLQHIVRGRGEIVLNRERRSHCARGQFEH
jgi:hypothetical protein